MQSINRYFSILALAIAVIAFSTVSFAQDTKTDTTKTDKTEKVEQRGANVGPECRKFGRFGRMARMGRMGRMGAMHRDGLGINLTDDQKARIKALREANKPDKATLDELRAIHESRKAGTDLTAEQKARINTIRDQMRTKAQSARDQIQGILTTEQKAQIEKLRNEMKERREQMRQKFEENRKFRRTPPTDKPAETKKPTI